MWILLLVTALFAAGPIPAQAQELDVPEQEHEENSQKEIEDIAAHLDPLTPEQLQRLHDRLDEDRDGKVSVEEIMEFASRMMTSVRREQVSAILEEVDTSNDGKLALDEHMADVHKNWNTDGDLEIFKAEETQKFKKADLDGDGLLDITELPRLWHQDTELAVVDEWMHLAEQALEKKDKDNDHKLSMLEFWSHDDGEAEIGPEEEETFKNLDLDKDGFLEVREYMEWDSGRFHTEESLLKLLAIADKDSDMHITAEELISSIEEIHLDNVKYHLMEWSHRTEL